MAAWLLIALVAGGAGLLVVVNMQDRSGRVPPTSMFAAAGILMSMVGLITVAIAAHRIGTSARAAITLGGGFAAIALAKFAMGPTALYQGNRHEDIQNVAGFSSGGLIIVIAVTIVLLYAAIVWFLAAVLRPVPPPEGPSFRPAVVFVLLALVGGVGVTILLTSAPLDYLRFVVTGLETFGIAISLFIAACLIGLGFQDTARRTRTLATSSVYLTLAWVVLAFLVIFQVLWIVFLLAVVAIWPLKSVTPK